jgi:uncharacterized protein (DUF1810 family)
VKSFGSDDALMVIAAVSVVRRVYFNCSVIRLSFAQVFNMAFATCGIVGALSGMGKAQAYLAHRPDDVHRGLLVGVRKAQHLF